MSTVIVKQLRHRQADKSTDKTARDVCVIFADTAYCVRVRMCVQAITSVLTPNTTLNTHEVTVSQLTERESK